jgi:hypothetical protein
MTLTKREGRMTDPHDIFIDSDAEIRIPNKGRVHLISEGDDTKLVIQDCFGNLVRDPIVLNDTSIEASKPVAREYIHEIFPD